MTLLKRDPSEMYMPRMAFFLRDPSNKVILGMYVLDIFCRRIPLNKVNLGMYVSGIFFRGIPLKK